MSDRLMSGIGCVRIRYDIPHTVARSPYQFFHRSNKLAGMFTLSSKCIYVCKQ